MNFHRGIVIRNAILHTRPCSMFSSSFLAPRLAEQMNTMRFLTIIMSDLIVFIVAWNTDKQKTERQKTQKSKFVRFIAIEKMLVYLRILIRRALETGTLRENAQRRVMGNDVFFANNYYLLGIINEICDCV